MFLKSIGARAVVELDSVDCEILARACRSFVGQDESETYALENAWCFFTAASAISRMHGWHNQPHDTQEKLNALCARTEGADDVVDISIPQP